MTFIGRRTEVVWDIIKEVLDRGAGVWGTPEEEQGDPAGIQRWYEVPPLFCGICLKVSVRPWQESCSDWCGQPHSGSFPPVCFQSPSPMPGCGLRYCWCLGPPGLGLSLSETFTGPLEGPGAIEWGLMVVQKGPCEGSFLGTEDSAREDFQTEDIWDMTDPKIGLFGASLIWLRAKKLWRVRLP